MVFASKIFQGFNFLVQIGLAQFSYKTTSSPLIFSIEKFPHKRIPRNSIIFHRKCLGFAFFFIFSGVWYYNFFRTNVLGTTWFMLTFSFSMKFHNYLPSMFLFSMQNSYKKTNSFICKPNKHNWMHSFFNCIFRYYSPGWTLIVSWSMPSGTSVVLYLKGPFPLIRTPSGIPSSLPPFRDLLRAYNQKENATIRYITS